MIERVRLFDGHRVVSESATVIIEDEKISSVISSSEEENGVAGSDRWFRKNSTPRPN